MKGGHDNGKSITSILWTAMLLLLLPSIASARHQHQNNNNNNNDQSRELQYIDKNLMKLLNDSIYMTSLTTDNELRPTSSCDDCDWIREFRTRLDGRIVAKRQGKCYAAFRGRFENIRDLRILDARHRTVCRDDVYDNNEEICCRTRGSIRNTFFTFFTRLNDRWEDAIEECISTTCDPMDDEPCLILSGHSLGGSYALFAAFILARYRPTVVTTGAPLAFLEESCSAINTSRVYNVENTIMDTTQSSPSKKRLVLDGTMYAFPNSNVIPMGHRFIISDEVNAVSYWGLDRPLPDLDEIEVALGEAHDLFGFPSSYVPKVEALAESSSSRSSSGDDDGRVSFGWDDGVPCLIDRDCKSGNCEQRKGKCKKVD